MPRGAQILTVVVTAGLVASTLARSMAPHVPPDAAKPAPNLLLEPSLSLDHDRDPSHGLSAQGLAPQGQPGFTLSFKNIVNPYSIFSAFLLPSEELELFGHAPAGTLLSAQTQGGRLEPLADNHWRWRAPAEPGLYPLLFTSPDGNAMRLHAFVLVPYGGTDQLNGYRIGRYQETPLRNDPAYLPPRGFLEITPELLAVHVSPNFRLGQFPCKQEAQFPKYMALQESLLLRLESLLAEVRERGIDASTFSILSGYRTPFYNAKIGNETSYSRHAYGDAADIFIDENGDGRMDDLNRNGRIDVRDAQVLLDIAEELERHEPEDLVGGLGLYGPRKHRGPFVHVDARGYPARWIKR
jgi:hypothetical protein